LEASRKGCGADAAALAEAEASGTHWADAELHRLRGDLLGRLPSADWTEVESCFRSALTVAREQGSRGFELRAAVSLARLLSIQGRREEARELLAPVYGWFTEGFDTPDMRGCKGGARDPRCIADPPGVGRRGEQSVYSSLTSEHCGARKSLRARRSATRVRGPDCRVVIISGHAGRDFRKIPKIC
jgi:hypothetical protein